MENAEKRTSSAVSVNMAPQQVEEQQTQQTQQQQQQQPVQYLPMNANSSENQVIVAPGKIRDYLPWSILNIFIGGLVLGVVAVTLSMFVQKRVHRQDFVRAKKLSIVTLIYNILVTLVGLAVWGYIIALIVITAMAASNSGNSSSG